MDLNIWARFSALNRGTLIYTSQRPGPEGMYMYIHGSITGIYMHITHSKFLIASIISND